MKMTQHWLERHLPALPDPSQVQQALMRMGIEVPSVKMVGDEYATVQLVKIVERRPHPSADHLSIVTLAGASGEPIEVVTGAPNGAVGDRVWYAPPGTKMLDGRVLEIASLRGVESPGMLLSREELGFGTVEDGLWIWNGDEPLGTTLLDRLGGFDTVYELELTPNLASFDQSAIGLARELAAYFRLPHPRLPDRFPFEQAKMAGAVDLVGAPVYGLVALDLTDAWTTPIEMQFLLRAIGQRVIAPMVDLTNFVLWDLGQPLHAFDSDTVQFPIEVRRARSGERLTALDGGDYELTTDDLVIADQHQVLAIAGVIGGQSTAIRTGTRRVIFESAHFNADTVYRTMRRLRIESDAALHFGKGTDPQAATAALSLVKAALNGVATVVASELSGVEPAPRKIRWDREHLQRLLGVDWSEPVMLEDLERLGFAVTLPWIVVPTFRPDIEALHDLAEEVLRVHGVDEVPVRMPPGQVTLGSKPLATENLQRLAQAWSEAGYWEVVTNAFTSESREQPFVPLGVRPIEVVNPLRPEDGRLRRSLLAGILETIESNRARSDRPCQLFEVAPVYGLVDGKPEERYQLVVAATLDVVTATWPHQPGATIYDVKSAFEWVMERLGFDSFEFVAWAGSEPWIHPGRALAIRNRRGATVGVLGEVRPRLAATLRAERLGIVVLDLPDPGDWPLARARVSKPSRFPRRTRDFTWTIGEEMTFADLEQALQLGLTALRATMRVDVALVDRYPGSQGNAYTFRVGLQSDTMTLTDAEITPGLDQMVREMEAQGAKLRR